MLLQASGLCAWYGAAQILFDVDLEVRKGEVVALIGPSHTLKSSSANLGALQLSELARRAEQDARAQTSDELGSLSTRAENEFQRVRTAFDELGLR